MKKYIYILCAALFLVLTACDYNDHNFEGWEDMSKPSNIAQYEYEITTADITTIVSGLRANKNAADSVMAKQLDTDKMFSELAPAENCIPYLLTSKYYTVDKNSSANVTYEFKHGRTDYLAALSNPSYQLTEADYKSVWGKEFVSALTPEKAPASQIPAILANNFTGTAGEYKIVDYYYSAEEPEYDIVEVAYLSEGFEECAYGSGVATEIDGWINKDISAALFWQCRQYSGNIYAQISSNNSKAENDAWLITKQIDLSDAAAPEFTFDYTSGYYNADCLTVLVSEDFNGSEGGIASAGWTDITSNFTFIQGTATGYGTLANVGTMDFSAYAGKKVYIAFRYVGNGTDNSASTTVQIDNIKLSEVKTAMSVASTQRAYAAYKFDGSKWAADNSIVVVQPEDYAEMGMSYLSVSNAPGYLPQFLAKEFPYAQEGTVKTVVFKSSNTANYADEYTMTEGQWVLNTFIEKKTSQFVYADKGWMFDPTLFVTMVKGKADTDDYMLVVKYVMDNYESGNPKLINSYRDSEYYYGFSANYGNISLRQSDRLNDVTYAALTSDEEKNAYFKERTIEGLEVYLSLKFPTQEPQVSGVDVHAIVTCAIYNGNYTDYNCVFEFECISTGKWEYVETITDPGMW